RERVADFERYALVEAALRELLLRDREHVLRRVEPDHARARARVRDLDREIARAGRDVEHARALAEPRAALALVLAEAERAHGGAPPALVEAHRQHAIEQVVPRRDAIEHLAAAERG